MHGLVLDLDLDLDLLGFLQYGGLVFLRIAVVVGVGVCVPGK